MTSRRPILDRIARQAGLDDLPEVLAARLPASDLASLLLHAMRERARRAPTELLAQVDRQPLLSPSSADARRLLELDRAAFAAAARFEAVELSPVSPLGTNFVLGGIDQNSVLSALRGTEVLADPTAAQALECARRRRELARRKDRSPVKLCSSHRAVRQQPVDVPGFTPHFRLFSLVSAGPVEPEDRFETESLAAHLAVYLELLRALAEAGWRIGRVGVALSDTELVRGLLAAKGVDAAQVRAAVRTHKLDSAAAFLAERGISLPPRLPSLDAAADELQQLGTPSAWLRLRRAEERVVAPLRRAFPEVDFSFELDRLAGLGYYEGLCLHLEVESESRGPIQLGDGGFTRWTQELLGNRKERLLTSGFGSELAVRLFAPAAAP